MTVRELIRELEDLKGDCEVLYWDTDIHAYFPLRMQYSGSKNAYVTLGAHHEGKQD